ncbi:MAG: anti-sigma factor antagonist [Frankiaceae bacterium]|jgi:anti-anti-sigma factor|nr:anti-sigma factor antagonist [Frankiaceae bacterium]
MTTQPLELSTVEVSTLDDGMLVRLRGRLDAGTAPALRDVLLRVRPAGCEDILVDAGGVVSIDDAALAVLIAAPLWAEATNARLAYTRVARPLAKAARDAGVIDLLPRMPPPGQRRPVD